MIDYNGGLVFLGDSFTWGQGLHYYYMIENHGWTQSDCKKFFDNRYRFEWLGFEADEYRRKYSFPYLVSNKLNKLMITPSFENGGDNKSILDILKCLKYFTTTNNVENIIIQFSTPTRNLNENEYKTVEHLIYTQIKKIDDECKRMNIKWIGFSWVPEFSIILKKYFPNNFTPIQYKNKEYHTITGNDENLKELFFPYDLKINDAHPNKLGHEIISKSIINKLKQIK